MNVFCIQLFAIVEIMSLEQTWDEVGQRTCHFDVGQAKRLVADAESFNLPFAQIKTAANQQAGPPLEEGLWFEGN